ncbi:MAG: YggU family protein [Gammaproteobacteria bacterium]|nr:MAG: YggU family protein [Gammaproteobacteria bacterium]
MSCDFAQWQDQDLLLYCHIQPRAKHTEFSGIHGDRLKIKLKAHPVDGKANQELIQFLAREFGIAKNQVYIQSGKTAKLKRILLSQSRVFPEQLIAF